MILIKVYNKDTDNQNDWEYISMAESNSIAQVMAENVFTFWKDDLWVL